MMSQKCRPCGWNYVQDPTGELTALPYLSGFGGRFVVRGMKKYWKRAQWESKGEGRETWGKIRESEGKKYLCLSASSQNAKYAPLTVKILCFCCVFSIQTVNVNIHMKSVTIQYCICFCIMSGGKHSCNMFVPWFRSVVKQTINCSNNRQQFITLQCPVQFRNRVKLINSSMQLHIIRS